MAVAFLKFFISHELESTMWHTKQSGDVTLLNKIQSTVFIRLTDLGAYQIFGPWEWALIRAGRLFEAGRLLDFHHFQQVKYVYFATK